jgi:alkylation response protein AidB-like acyl-CoA dehydrogenase
VITASASDLLLAVIADADAVLRTDADGPVTREVWDSLAEAGLPALLVPSRCGGLGLGLLDASLVATRLATLSQPLPFLSSAVVATRLLTVLGADGLLAELATGDRVLSVAVDEQDVVDHVLDSISCQAVQDGTGWALTGCKTGIPDGLLADSLLVVARDRHGLGAFVVERPIFAEPCGDDRPGRIVLDAVPARRLPGLDHRAALERSMDDASTVLSAELLGAAEAALRPADDAPLHDRVPELVPAHLWTRYAAWCSDHDAEERRWAAAHARLWAARLVAAVEGLTAELPDGRAKQWHRATGRHAWIARPAWRTVDETRGIQ